MRKHQLAELKWVADHLNTQPIQAKVRFKNLIREVSGADRLAIADTLREMLADCGGEGADYAMKAVRS